MSREIISEAMNGIHDKYVSETVAQLGLFAAGAAAGASAGGGVDPATLFPLSGTETAAKAGFGAWLAKGGWIALAAGVLVAAGVAAGAFFFGKGGDVPPVGTGEVTTDAGESLTVGEMTEKPTESESEYQSDTEHDTQPQQDPHYLRFPLTDPDDTASYVSLPDPSAEDYPKLAFFTPVGEGNSLKEAFALPIPTEGEQNILVLLCEGILDPSQQTGSHYAMIYFIESTFTEVVEGIEQRTVQMRCGRVDFYDTPMPTPSGDSTLYVDHHSDRLSSASVTYSDANRSSVLARTRHNNQLALANAEELLYEYGKETYKLTVLYSNMADVEIVNTSVESLPEFPFELFRTHALP